MERNEVERVELSEFCDEDTLALLSDIRDRMESDRQQFEAAGLDYDTWFDDMQQDHRFGVVVTSDDDGPMAIPYSQTGVSSCSTKR